MDGNFIRANNAIISHGYETYFDSYTRDHWTIDPVLGRPRTWPTNDLQDFSRLHYRAAFPNRLAHLEPTPTLCSVLYSQTYCLQYQLNPLTFQVA